MNDKRYTIKDIAKMAGVSAGTVDRVMHNRGEVSETSRLKVQQVLDEIDYKPNMFAIGLAAKKKYSIACFIPSYIDGDYWCSVAEGIKKAADELHSFNVNPDFIHYNHSDIGSYRKAQQDVLDKKPDGVLIAPNFSGETQAFTRRLQEENIPFSFIDVNVEGVNALSYIGQDSYRSGYIAAKLLANEYEKNSDLVLFLSHYNDNTAEFQIQRRLEGFMKYLEENGIKINIHEVILSRDNYEENKKKLSGFFDSHPAAGLGVVFNSRIYQVGKFLEETGIQMSGLIGYDLLSQNVELLKKGIISYLIGQRPGLQGYFGVKTLADKIVFKKEVSPVKYMSIDILTRENIDYYFEFI